MDTKFTIYNVAHLLKRFIMLKHTPRWGYGCECVICLSAVLCNPRIPLFHASSHHVCVCVYRWWMSSYASSHNTMPQPCPLCTLKVTPSLTPHCTAGCGAPGSDATHARTHVPCSYKEGTNTVAYIQSMLSIAVHNMLSASSVTFKCSSEESVDGKSSTTSITSFIYRDNR